VRWRSKSQTLRDVRFTLVCGAAIATFYSLWVAVVVGATRTNNKYGVALGTIIGAYYAAAMTGGLVVGLMLPLGKYTVGRILLGIVVGCIVFFCVAMAMNGPFWIWKVETWHGVMTLGTFFGIVSALSWRRVAGR